MKGVFKMLKERKNQELVCNECGISLGGESVFEFEGNIYCEECFDRLTVVCDCCGDRIWRDNAEGDSLTTLCEHCYDYSYGHCERCGRLVNNDDLYYLADEDDYGYCYDCYQGMISKPIKNYGYKPTPIFYGDGPLYLGIELEIDKGSESEENAQIFLDYINKGKELLYIKRDGSISNGMEWVFHPMSLDYALNSVDFKGLFEKAVSMGYRSHQTQTCGLHIHVNRTAFGKTYDEQEEVIARIVFFVEKHWCELVKFSRRTTENLNRWAAKYATISPTTEETYQKAKSKHLGRYTAVNLETYEQQTVELRLFRGTLRYKTFVATLQLVDEICHICKYLDDEELEALSWSSFVTGIYDKLELIEYLKSKRLYVNELPIEEQEEM